MNLFNRTKRVALIIFALYLMSFLLIDEAYAEPYLAYKTGLKCMSCHVNASGGGLRTSFGRAYGHSVLPSRSFNTTQKNETPSALSTQIFNAINEYLQVGTDVRFNAIYQRTDDRDSQKTFETENALLYSNFTLPNSGLSLYIDQQIAPGSAINRETYIQYQFDNGNRLKVGRLFLPFGMRIQDDNAFIRQATGQNFDNSDNGVEFLWDNSQSTINVFIANGTSQSSNDDDTFMYGIRGEYLFQNMRVGSSLLLNRGDNQSNKTTIANLYSGLSLGKLTLLSEIDVIKLESEQHQDVTQYATLVEANYQIMDGWNMKLTAEYFDPNDQIDENHQTRYSWVHEYTPFSALQLRLGIRTQDSIPQQSDQNIQQVFIQSHFYY